MTHSKDDHVTKLPSGLVLIDFEKIKPKNAEQAKAELEYFFGKSHEKT